MRSPPLPAYVRDLLDRYPALIEELEHALATVVSQPAHNTPPFEVAVWVLESKLANLITRARIRLEQAQADGDTEIVHAAEQQLLLMQRAHSRNGGLHNLDELWAHFNGSRS